VLVIQHASAEALTTGRMMSSGNNIITITGSIPLLVDYQSPRTSSSSSQYFGTGMFYYYHWVDTSAGGQLVPEDIIRPVVNASALAYCVTSTWSIPLLVDY
jgi:hypothetical protein